MKLRLILIFFWLLLAADVSADESLVLKTQSDNLNYALGVEMARNLKRQGVEVSPDVMLKGLKDGLSGGELLMSNTDLRRTMVNFQAGQRLKKTGLRKTSPADSKMMGYSTMEQNKRKEGVEVLPSGQP